MAIRWRSLRPLAVAVALAVTGAPAHAGDVASDMKKAGKSIAKAAKKFGSEVAEGSKEIDAAAQDRIRKLDAEIARLEKENAELRRR